VIKPMGMGDEPLAQKFCASLEEGLSYVGLLQAMEVGGEEDEEEGNPMEEEEMLLLPEEWVYSTASSTERKETVDIQDSNLRGEGAVRR
jgi:hypothetical protein